MEPVVLVGNLPYREYQVQQMELKLKEGEERLDSRGMDLVFAGESLTSEDDLQCELMRFVEGACTCSCVLYELAHGGN